MIEFVDWAHVGFNLGPVDRLGLLVESVDWAPVGFSFGPIDRLGLLVGGSGPKPMVPTACKGKRIIKVSRKIVKL